MSVRELSNVAAMLFESIAAVFLAAIMLATIADVVLRTIDPTLRILGIVEVVQLTFGWTVFIALPAIVLTGQNIVVNVFDERISKAALRYLIGIGSIVAAVYIGLVLMQVVITGLDGIAFGDQTQDLAISIVWFWLPIWIGFGAALLGQLVVIVWPILPPDREASER